MIKKAVIFDLDGTLIDSLKDIAINANLVLKELGHPQHSIDDYKNFVGDGAKILIQNALPNDASEKQLIEALELFKKYYEQNLQNSTHLYDGINDLLEVLQNENIPLAVLSNKPDKFTKLYVEKLLPNIDFIEVSGQKEDIPKKPAPNGAISIAKKMGINPKDIYFIGDTATDMKTAKNSGMIAVGVAWGFRGIIELVDNDAAYILDTPQDLIDIVKGD